MKDTPARVLGAIVGGAIGVAAHWLLLRSSIQMAGVAGIGLALGVSAAARSRSLSWGVITALLALALSLVTEWWFRPFLADGSFTWFVQHLDLLDGLTLASLLAAAAIGFYLGRGRAAHGGGQRSTT